MTFLTSILKPLIAFLCITSIFALETDLYDFSWLDKDKEVYVLQNRKFRKINRFYVTAGYGMTTSGSFVDATSIQARAGYFFTENYGFEFVYSLNSGEENEAAKSVRSSSAGAGTIPFRRIVDGYYGAMFMWSPFYSKINTFNKIIYVDFLFGLGLATLTETNNRDQFVTSDPFAAEVQESHTGILWNFGAKFFVNTSWSVRFDLNAVHYQALQARVNNPEDYIYSNFDLVGSLVYDL